MATTEESGGDLARRAVPSGAANQVGDCPLGSWYAENEEHISRRSTSWLNPAVLWAARNEVVSWIADPVDAERAHWVAMAEKRAVDEGRSADFVLDETDGAGAVIVLGDPGEGDLSQYAVLPALEAAGAGVHFGVVCSDVIYPAGSAGDYRDKFVWPYRRLEFPLWAVPGNHDWYDGLRGFLANFCGVEAADPSPSRTSFPGGLRGRVARALWRRDALTAGDLAGLHDLPPATRAARRPQPAPYFAVDTPHIRYVGIDTGITGRIDARQREWLRRVSTESPAPKVLLTGKPLYVNGALDERTKDVDEIVRDPESNYVAAIGGDTHNYQRYSLDVGGGRVIHYIVSGGGGAFMHDTHSIPRVHIQDADGRLLLDEPDVRLFPLRRDSMARYSEVLDRKLCLGLGLLRVTPGEAGLYFVQKMGINPLPVDEGDDMSRRMSLRLRARIAILSRLYAGPWFHRFFGPIVLDWDRPPVFKQFLRLEPSEQTLVVRCLSADGCAGSERSVVEQDRVAIRLT
ncbi:MAG: hypothetical protein QOE59_965 [Actinomycetota bacterium]|nr:hypothetical protein [Actinomycetota bacterium]